MWDQVLPMNEIGDRLLPVPYNYDFGYLPNLLSLLQKGIESRAIPVGCQSPVRAAASRNSLFSSIAILLPA